MKAIIKGWHEAIEAELSSWLAENAKATSNGNYDRSEYVMWWDELTDLERAEWLREAYDVIEDDALEGTVPTYELGYFVSRSGNPVLYYPTIEISDIVHEIEEDDE
jgi:hypothetical protein